MPYRQLSWGIEGGREVNAAPRAGEKEHWITQTDNLNQDVRDVASDDEPLLKGIFAEALFDEQRFADLENKEPETRIKSAKPDEETTRQRVVTIDVEDKRELSTGAGTYGDSETQGLQQQRVRQPSGR